MKSKQYFWVIEFKSGNEWFPFYDVYSSREQARKNCDRSCGDERVRKYVVSNAKC